MSCTNHRDQVPIGLVIPHIRQNLVREVVRQVHAAEVDAGTALLMLDVIGLTGDREVLSEALASLEMADGLRDGRYDPRYVDPQLRVPRDEAVEILAGSFDDRYETAVVKLAVPRVAPDPLAAVTA